ncbi:MAG: FAD-dependent oxidoreductase [Phycisphaerae bacterium]
MHNLYYFHQDWVQPSQETLSADLCVYGASAGGTIAAIKAARLGLSVVLLQPGKHIGGMTSGGLGWTDFGRKYVIGGMSRQFYRDLGKNYGRDEEWQFEPHVAENQLAACLDATDVTVRFCSYLDEVFCDGARIAAISLLGGLRVEAKMFIDASYEGDLMAGANVRYTVGREGNDVYREKLNGIQVRDKHQFSHPVDPYVVAGDPSSGLLPHVIGEDLSASQGRGDNRVQAYNFRVCMTDDPELKIDWAKPDGFDPAEYVLATRWFNSRKDAYNEHLHDGHLGKFDIFPNKTPGGYHKTDTNNQGPVSSDFIGANYAWPEADYAAREKLFQAHVTYQQGLYWHMANCPEIPSRYRQAYQQWGLARDEFTDTAHWPHQLYVREARRLVGDYVITEHDCTGAAVAPDSIGMGSYTMDSHNTARFVKVENGQARVLNEGDVQVPPTDPYPVSYRAILPPAGQVENLLVPICFSASHIAYGSARMEPVFMVLGESAATAVKIALDNGCGLHDVKYDELRPELLSAGQVLELPPADQRTSSPIV